MSIAMILSMLCCSPTYKDISRDPEYTRLVGREFKTLDEFLIFGYATDLRSKALAGYFIAGRPGIAGSEIISRGVLPVGSTIRVEEILTCFYCLDLRVFVTITSDRSYDGTSAEMLGSNIFVASEEGVAQEVNPRLFAPIE